MDAKHFLCNYLMSKASGALRHRGIRLVFSLVVAVATGMAVSPLALAQSPVAQSIHTVAAGETLSELAERYDTTVDELVRINGLASADYIWAGQRLVVGVEKPTATGAGVHLVQAGENLLWIAARYGVSVESIVAANGLGDPNRILAGQTLKIPEAASGSASSSNAPAGRGGAVVRLEVPFRSQFTGSPYEESDCGPAALGMLLSYYGKDISTDTLRQWVMESTRYWGYDGGSDWKSLVYASKKAGLQVQGLYNPSGGYRKWTLDDLEAQLKAGNPVMPLVRFKALPGHTNSAWWGDHYIVLVGIVEDGQFLYHDSAFRTASTGAYRTISAEALRRAWSTVSERILYSAMTLAKQ